MTTLRAGSFVTETTAAALDDPGDAINTVGKYTGKLVRDESKRVFIADGGTVGADWYPIYDPLGVEKITP